MVPPVVFGFLGEFIKTVFEELSLALKRRRRRQEEAEEKKKRELELHKRAEAEELAYQKHLAKLKQTSKIPENPYDE